MKQEVFVPEGKKSGLQEDKIVSQLKGGAAQATSLFREDHRYISRAILRNVSLWRSVRTLPHLANASSRLRCIP
jgi:hypothetical protein